MCLEFVPAGVSCLCPYDNMLPIGPDNLTHTHTHIYIYICMQNVILRSQVMLATLETVPLLATWAIGGGDAPVGR